MHWRLPQDRAATQSNQIAERVDLLHHYGLQQLTQGHYAEAAASFGRTVKIQPDDALAWYYRGDALANLKRYKEALDSFDQVLDLEPEHYDAWTFRAVVLIHLGRYSDAVCSCDRALALCPQHSEAFLFRGAALQHLGEYRRAYASYDSACGIEHSSLLRWFQNRLAKLVRFLGGWIKF